jgi:hypothetical protein
VTRATIATRRSMNSESVDRSVSAAGPCLYSP